MRLNLSKIGHDFVVYDGVNLSDHFIVRTFDMPWLPNIDANTLLIDGKPGEWFAGRNIGTRDVIIGLGLLNETREREDALEHWIRLTNKVAKNKVAKMEIGHGFYIWCMLIGESLIESNGKWSIVEVTFRCFDPYIYGEKRTYSLKTGDNEIPVSGGGSTFPVFEITGASTVTITHKETGEKFRTESVPTGQTLIVDMEHYNCTANGLYQPIDASVSDFWSLEPGKATINLSSGSGTVTYNEVYL